MPEQSLSGSVVTFYSYKGGTGRTMALANAGCLLAERGEGDVLLIDFDLEAPGLHSFFRGWLGAADATDDKQIEEHPGLIEFLLELRAHVGDGDEPQPEADARATVEAIDLERYVMPTGIPRLHLMKAGGFVRSYAERINSFDWTGFYRRSPWLMRTLAEHLAERFAYVLIDSRTGFTDSSGVCTMLLPEKLVVVFTPGRQSLFGVGDLIERATAYRRESDDLRPLVVFPLPSRIDITEEEFQRLWRHGDRAAGLEGFQPQFERLLREVYALDDCFLGRYFDDVQLQHVSTYAYGEQIAVLNDTGHRLSLAQSYKTFTQHLVTLQGPWELEDARRPLARPREAEHVVIDRAAEQELFEQLIRGHRNEHVLALEDVAGAGKSTLLQSFATICRSLRPKPVPVSLVPLSQLPTDDPFAVLSAIRRDLGVAGVAFPQFDHCEDDRATSAAAKLLSEPKGLRESKRRCEEAFTDDLRHASAAGPIALLLDDVDAAPPDARALIQRVLLDPRGGVPRSVVVVFAGRSLPPELVPASALRVKGLSALHPANLAEYVRAALGRELEPGDLALVGQLLERGVPIGQIIATIFSLTGQPA